MNACKLLVVRLLIISFIFNNLAYAQTQKEPDLNSLHATSLVAAGTAATLTGVHGKMVIDQYKYEKNYKEIYRSKNALFKATVYQRDVNAALKDGGVVIAKTNRGKFPLSKTVRIDDLEKAGLRIEKIFKINSGALKAVIKQFTKLDDLYVFMGIAALTLSSVTAWSFGSAANARKYNAARKPGKDLSENGSKTMEEAGLVLPQ